MFRLNSNTDASPNRAATTAISIKLIGAALALSLIPTFASANNETKAENKKASKETKTSNESEENGAAISTNTQKVRDPFVVPSRVKREPKVPVKKEPRPVPVPDIESRLTSYRNLVRAAASNGSISTPEKLSPYLVEELTITGIFRDEAGYGAFVAAEPTKLTFFARPGQRTHDGVVKEVLPNGIKFIRTIRYDDGTVRQTEEFRALRSLKPGK